MRLPVRGFRRVIAASVLAAVFFAPDSSRLIAQTAVHPLAEAPSYGDLTPAVEYARAMLETMRTERGVPGLSVAVGVDGQVVWAEGFGWADVENRVPATEDTRFRVGSVSKPLTAAAMGILIDEGRLDLDAPVQQYVPSFPEKPWPVTSRMVAGHLAGIRHYVGDDEFLSTRMYGSVAEGLEIFADDDLLFEPGERFSYSSYGWNLLSAVVEGASGEAFLPYMDARVFDPLGMTSTVADHTDSIIAHRTRFYEVADDGRVYNSPFVDNSYKWAGGGFLSTPSDLVRFGMAHLDGVLLRPETIEMMWTSQRTTAGEETGNGVGWFLETKPDGRRTVSHGGGSIGGVTYLLVLPEDGAVAALTANTSQGVGMHRAAYLLAEAFLDPSSVATLPDPAIAASWAGNWNCEASRDGNNVASAGLQLAERGGRIAGLGGWEILREDEENVMTEVTVAWSDPESSRLAIVVVDDRGNPTQITLDDSGASAAGSWFDGNRGELTCTHEAP
jgi:CubicO group peptidase (beta-lactamase class C family)